MNDIAPKLDPARRTVLESQLAAIGDAEKALDALMEPLRQQMQPYLAALSQLQGVRDTLLEAAGVELADETCEGCGCVLFTGDLVHRCADGPILCQACAPTFRDVLHQWQQKLAEDDAQTDPAFKLDADDRREAEDIVTRMMAVLAIGEGDKKAVQPL